MGVQSCLPDGLTRETRHYFLVKCLRGTMFIASIDFLFVEPVDAFSHVKACDMLFELLDNKVKYIGNTNVVQVITNNHSSYVTAGKNLDIFLFDYSLKI